MIFLSEAAKSLEAAGSAGRSELERGRHGGTVPFSCLIFDPVSAQGTVASLWGGACLHTGRKRLANRRGGILPRPRPQNRNTGPTGRLTGAFFLASHSLDLWCYFFWLLLLDLLAMERIFKNLLSGL